MQRLDVPHLTSVAFSFHSDCYRCRCSFLRRPLSRLRCIANLKRVLFASFGILATIEFHSFSGTNCLLSTNSKPPFFMKDEQLFVQHKGRVFPILQADNHNNGQSPARQN